MACKRVGRIWGNNKFLLKFFIYLTAIIMIGITCLSKHVRFSFFFDQINSWIHSQMLIMLSADSHHSNALVKIFALKDCYHVKVVTV